MKVVGLYLVRNEVDLIEVNLLHHFATAIDEAIVIDNGSSDGSLEKLVELAETMPIRLASEPGPYDQSARVTRMAREAVREGADWVLPIDADEFWIGVGQSLRSVLAEVPADVFALRAEVVNFIQSRDVLTPVPQNLLSMTMRPPAQVGPIELCEDLVESQQIGFVEMMYPPKWVSRATSTMVITNGNHGVIGLPDNVVTTDRVLCLHAPLRARSLLTGKLDQGRRVIEDEGRKDYWHVRRWWRLSRQGAIDAEWGANSYQHGYLEVGGQSRELVSDMRLRDAVAAVLHPPGPTDGISDDATHPSIAAYLLALDTVPGSLSALDFRLLVGLDEMAREHDIRGDILEIGGGTGQRAILLGHLARLSGRRLLLFDLAHGPSTADASGSRRALVDQYLRFHDRPPVLCGDLSGAVGVEILNGGFRLVLVDDTAAWDAVRDKVSGIDSLLRPGGIISLAASVASDLAGTEATAWAGHLPAGFVPLCLTDDRLYGSWPSDSVDWLGDIDAWVAARPDLQCDSQTLAGQPVRRIRAVPRPVVTRSLTAIPALEGRVSPDRAESDPGDNGSPGPGTGNRQDIDASAPAPTGQYDAAFYEFTGDAARTSARVIVPLVLELTRAESVVDVRSGTGSWLSVFRQYAVDDVLGLDGEHVDLAMLEIPRAVFQPWNLERRLPVARRFDLAVCLEVAEHVSADRADALIDDLVRLAPVVLFSAAAPLQGGVGHVNEQWPTYWVRKFAERGLSVIDAVRPVVWDNELVAMWYAQNCLLFAAQDALDRHESLAAAQKETNERQLDLIHPSLYLYHRLGLTSPAWRVPLDAAAHGMASPEPVTEPVLEPDLDPGELTTITDGGPTPALASSLGLRSLLKALPAATRRALVTRLGHRRRGP